MPLEKLRALKFQPFVSGLLVAINVLVFFVGTYDKGSIYDAGMLRAFEVLEQREYDRIIWSLFLHNDISHLFNNMFLLFFMGAMIEKEIGHVRFGILYFLSGIGGNIVSLIIKVVKSNFSASLGASGAIFGLDGVLLAMVLFSEKKMENVTPARVLLMIAYSLYSGFTGRNIDNAAHVGGLFTGFVLAAIMCGIGRLRRKGDQL